MIIVSLRQKNTNKNILQIRKMRMENISYTAHVSNKKSAITSKSKLTGVAKHNLRKYKSSDYSKDNIFIIYGTSNLIDDVKTVFTKDVLSRVLQDELREVANKEVNDWFGKQIKEKSKGRNHDLSVAEYKVAQETKHLTQLQEQVEESDRAVKANKAVEKEYTDKKEKLEFDISYMESMRRITKSLSEMDSRESKHISKELDEKRSELQSVNQELASAIEKAEDAAKLLDRIKKFVSSFRLFAPTIEEYANQVESDRTIEVGNSFRGILNELGKLLEAFKELIKEGLCWFPRLMRWKTSKGEVAPVFLEKSNGYSYSLYGYMDVETKEYYFKESVQWEIKAGNRTGTAEQMDANVEAMARDLQEILRIGAEQKRLREVYERR